MALTPVPTTSSVPTSASALLARGWRRVSRIRLPHARQLFFTATASWALCEVFLLGALILGVCLTLTLRATTFAALLNVNDLIAGAVGPLLALWCALRLRWDGRTGVVGAFSEARRALLMSLLLGLLPLAVILLTLGRVIALSNGAMPPFPREFISMSTFLRFLAERRVIAMLVVLALGVSGEFLAIRAALWVLRWWNRLRRRHLQWALTHAHLTVVVLAVAFLACILEGAELALSPASALRSLIPVGVVLVVGLVASIALVFPPSVAFSFLFARRTTRRLRTLANATSALRAGDYAQRVTVEGEDEVAQVQENFNAMAAALEESVRELEAERDRVAGLLLSRRELIASVSHELRTPVATLRGYLEYSAAHLESGEGATLRQDFATMEGEAARLQALIQDLFTLSRAEVGQLEMRCAPTDVGAVAERVAVTLAPLAWERGRVTVVATVEPDLPCGQVDPGRLEQVLHNLVHNALRHTPPGGIVAIAVSAGACADATTARELCVAVRDTGEGIASEALPHVFERFYRTVASRHMAESGSGLGLALVKELTEAMGGSVVASSVLGEGACFALRLPVAPHPAESVAP